MSQSIEQIIIDLSEWKELESKRIRELGKDFLEKKYDTNKKYLDEIVDLGNGNSLKKKVTTNSKINSIFVLLHIFTSFPFVCKLVFLFI